MIKNIVLDMGNVLLRYDPAIPLNLYCKTEEEKKVIRRELFEGPEWIQRDLGNITDEEKYESVKQRVPESMRDSLKQCVYGWHVCIKPVPGAEDFCSYAVQKGYRLYVLSNAAPDFYEYFPRFLPFEWFDGIVVSSDLHMIKPEAGIYRHLLEKYCLVPEECLFLDDLERNIKGAIQAGMKGEVFQNDFETVKIKYSL